MDLGLKGKRVLVTGSSRGIGFAIAKGFLSEKAKVVFTSRNQADLDSLKQKLTREFPDEIFITHSCDFTISKSVRHLKADVLQLWGGLDILIANVGSGKSVNDPIPNEKHFNLVINNNFSPSVIAVREFLPLLVESKGNILFISSIAGIEAIGAPIDYSVAKSAIISFAKNLSCKIAEYGIRVNCIAPGNIYFKGGTWDEKLKADSSKVNKYIASVVPMKRFGIPEEIAMPSLFLCSDRASFITGALLCVDGGQTKVF